LEPKKARLQMASRTATRVAHGSLHTGLGDQPASTGTVLTLNFFPAKLSQASVPIWSGLYSSPEATKAVEDSIPGSVTWRDPDESKRLYLWHPKSVFTTPPGFSPVTVRLTESPRLFERLIEDAVFARLREIGFQEKSDGWVNYQKPSLLAQVPSLASAVSEEIGIYPKILAEVFFTKDATNELAIGLVVDVLYTTRMEISAAEWVAAGLQESLRGTYVNLLPDSPEAARFPECVGRCVGRIDGFRGSDCVLADLRNPGLATTPLTSVAPEPSRVNLGKYLAARYEHAFANGEKALTQQLRELVRPQSRYKFARGLVLERLQPPESPYADDGLMVLPDVFVSFGDMQPTSANGFPVRRLTDPEFSFDAAGQKYGRRIDQGLERHGPYDQRRMSREEARLLVVVPAEHLGDAKLAMQKLLSGVPTQKNVFTGLKRMYCLENLQVTYAVAASANMRDYAEAVNRAVREAPVSAPGTPRFHMLLTVIRESHRNLPTSENPYYQTKALALITEGVPTQAVTVEKLRKRDDDLQYILNTLALACYAKLGGTSHVLKLPNPDHDTPTELIFGIGRSSGSVLQSGRYGEREQTVGFATVFRANGEYLYNDSTPYCDDAQYEQALEATIRRTIERVVAFEQLPDGAPLQLIFHVSRRPGRREEQPILNAVGKLPRFKIKFALVHVNEDHHFQLFDLRNVKPRSFFGGPKPDAMYLPPRGLAVSIGPRERLVTFVGVDQYRGNGSPAPLRITLDRRSTFTDIDYLTQQLYLLSFMSVRSLNPGVKPVTIAYAERLAQLTGQLRGVQQWTVQLIQQKLGRKLWFI
jgi:hypothetical protein